MRTAAALLFLLLALAAAACSNEEAVAEPADVRQELPAQGELLSAAEYVARADGRAGSGDLSAAIRDYTAALVLDKDNLDALKKRAGAYVHISLFHPEDDRPQLCRPGPACQYAIDDYDKLVKLLPSDSDVHYRRGAALINAGRYQSALAALEMAIELDPSNAEARLRRGYAYMRLSDDKTYGDYNALTDRPEDAIADFDEAIRLRPGQGMVYTFRGRAFMELGQLDRALVDLSKAIDLAPDDPLAYLDRGRTLMLSGRLDEAVADFDRALELDANRVDALVGRGEARTKLGLLDDALEDLERAVNLDPRECRSAHQTRQRVQRKGRPRPRCGGIRPCPLP